MSDDWQRTTVLGLIEAAFADLTPPAPDETPEPGCNMEAEEIRAFFRGRHWRDIPSSEIPWEGSFLYHLSPGAFRFYLPAFMRAVIEDYPRLDTLPIDLVSVLTPGTDRSASWVRTLDLFSASQTRAVQRFLEYIRDRHRDEQMLPFFAEMALEKYWSRAASAADRR